MEAGETGLQLLKERSRRGNFVIVLARLMLGLGASFVLARLATNWLFDNIELRAERIAVELSAFLILSFASLMLTSARPMRKNMARIAQVVEQQEIQREIHDKSQKFHRDVQQAFDMAESENELFDVAGTALAVAHDGPAEILVADASNAHINQTTVADEHAAPGCGVSSPAHCPAVRRGQTLNFDDPNGMASCPRLRERKLADGVRATCVPITVLGSPTAVLHALQETPIDNRALKSVKTRLEDTAVSFGARLGMIRAMTQTQLQADTDPLTGLLNRRATENLVRQLRSDGTSFAVAMADLDHFKQLNDTFGHDTGDRALRLFARVMKATVRESDLVSRHGGEEFVMVLPHLDVVSAAPVLHRLRHHLAEALTDAQLPPFTTSLGLADSTASDDYQEILDAADQALMRAKSEGRDRLVIGDSSAYTVSDVDSAVS